MKSAIVPGTGRWQAGFLEEVAGLGFWRDGAMGRKKERAVAQTGRVTPEPNHKHDTHMFQLKQWEQGQRPWAEGRLHPTGL